MKKSLVIVDLAVPSDQEAALKLLGKFSHKLPRITFGMRDVRFRERKLTRSAPQAAMQKRVGHILDVYDLFTIVLTPDGIFQCPYVLSEPEEADFLRSKGLDPLPLLYPDWQRRRARPDLWLEYHDKILEILKGLRPKKRRAAPTPKKER